MNENKKEIRGFRGVLGVRLAVRLLTVFACFMCVISALASVIVYSLDMAGRSEDEIINGLYSEITENKAGRYSAITFTKEAKM